MVLIIIVVIEALVGLSINAIVAVVTLIIEVSTSVIMLVLCHSILRIRRRSHALGALCVIVAVETD